MATDQTNKPRARGGRIDLSTVVVTPVPPQPAAPPAQPAAPPQPATVPAPQPAPEPEPARATEPEPETPAAPAEAPRRQQAPRRTRERPAAQPPSQDVDLSRVLSNQPVTADDQPPRSLSLQEMLSLRRKRVDPLNDFGPDGTRQLVWVQDAVKLVSDLTGYTQQEVYRDAVLGIRPLPPELLDETFANRYGYPRPKEMR